MTGGALVPVDAIVLAAGRGSRMGAPKALVRWGERSLARAHAVALRDGGSRRVVVVIRDSESRALRGDLALPNVEVVVSFEPELLGPAGSIRAALRSGQVEASSVIVAPCDSVPVRAMTLERLLTAHRRRVEDGGRRLATVPAFEGRSGHPVVVTTSLLEVLGEQQPVSATLRELIGREDVDVERLRVDDPAVRADIDTPEQLDFWRCM